MRRALLGILFACTLASGSCSSASPPAESPGLLVETFGALRDVMHDGDTSAVVRLESLAADADRVGLGALSGLRGEVMMLHGQTLLAYPDGPDRSRTAALSPGGEGAVLFVTARVPEWQSFTLEHDVLWADLDAFLETIAAERGLDPAEAFPFIIEGPLSDLQWHVIDGARIPPGAGGHAAHRDAAVTHQMPQARATLVGFYSDHHQGVFTHMDSRTHVHASVAEPLSSGHVDRVDLRAGCSVQLPAVRSRP